MLFARVTSLLLLLLFGVRHYNCCEACVNSTFCQPEIGGALGDKFEGLFLPFPGDAINTLAAAEH